MSEAVCCWCRSPLVEQQGAWFCSNRDPACRTRQLRWSVSQQQKVRTKNEHVRWGYVPTPKQAEFHETTRRVRRVLYGGQAGPGKSHGLRWGLYFDCLTIPNLSCLLLRRTFQQLEQTHLDQMVREAGLIGATYLSGDRVMRFQNGSVIRAGHCENVADAQNYLSTEYDRIAFDELVTFDQKPALEIMSRARTSKREVKANGNAQVWAGTNPGGRGAAWVKDFFIDRTVDRERFPSYKPERYAFVQAKLEDNPYISEEYKTDLEDLDPIRKRQLLYGDWDVFEGQFFGDLFREQHGGAYHERSIVIPHGTEWSAGMDWGYNAPGWIGFFAHLPDGHYHLAKEYKFQGQTADAVATTVLGLIKDLRITRLRAITADPAMWAKTGAGKGESIGETLARRRLPMRKGDNDRFNGWQRLHEFFRDDGAGRPYLTVDPGCRYWWRSLPNLVQDAHDADDLDTNMDDHAADGTRYWAMSRPSPTRLRSEPPVPPKGSAGEVFREIRGEATRRPVLGQKNVRRRVA